MTHRKTMINLQILCNMADPRAPNTAAGEAALTSYIGGLPVEVVDAMEERLCEGWAALPAGEMHDRITAVLRGEK